MSRAAVVVLAAGASRRMGRNKLLLEVAGEPMVRRAVAAALASEADRVVVVLGHEAERVRAPLAALGAEIVLNSAHADGAATSVVAGLRAVMDDADAVVIALADMPFVTGAMIAALIERHRRTRAPLVLSRYGDVQAPPTLYGRALFGELLALTGDAGGKPVAQRHRGEAEEVTWPPEALRDVDTPEDVPG